MESGLVGAEKNGLRLNRFEHLGEKGWQVLASSGSAEVDSDLPYSRVRALVKGLKVTEPEYPFSRVGAGVGSISNLASLTIVKR
jgi:hypothetical protein